MGYYYPIGVQVLLKIEFYKSLTMKNCWFWVTFWGTNLILGYKSFRSIIHLRWANDCAISHYCAIFHENCAISHSLFLVQKLISRKFHFQKKWFVISLCSLLFVLCLSKSRDLTNTKYGKKRLVITVKIYKLSKHLHFNSFHSKQFKVRSFDTWFEV